MIFFYLNIYTHSYCDYVCVLYFLMELNYPGINILKIKEAFIADD